MNDKEIVWLLDGSSQDHPAGMGKLAHLGFDVRHFGSSEQVLAALESDRPTAVVVALDSDSKRVESILLPVRSQCSRRIIPFLGLSEVTPPFKLMALFDDCVTATSLPELGTRILAVRERICLGGSAGVGARFLSILVHDLRTPLNVIILTHRVMEQTLSRAGVDLQEDLEYLYDNAIQIELMLSLVGDYCGYIDPESQSAPYGLDPRRFVEDLLGDRHSQAIFRHANKRLVVDPSCPQQVAIDPTVARLALIHAMGNAVAVAGGSPVVVTLAGEDDHWKVTIHVDQPPDRHVESFELETRNYQRIRGALKERRGFDLALTSRIIQQAGGQARLEVVPNQGSSIILKWPLHSGLESRNGH